MSIQLRFSVTCILYRRKLSDVTQVLNVYVIHIKFLQNASFLRKLNPLNFGLLALTYRARIQLIFTNTRGIQYSPYIIHIIGYPLKPPFYYISGGFEGVSFTRRCVHDVFIYLFAGKVNIVTMLRHSCTRSTICHQRGQKKYQQKSPEEPRNQDVLPQMKHWTAWEKHWKVEVEISYYLTSWMTETIAWKKVCLGTFLLMDHH